MQKNTLIEQVFCIYSYFGLCFACFCVMDVAILCLYSKWMLQLHIVDFIFLRCIPFLSTSQVGRLSPRR